MRNWINLIGVIILLLTASISFAQSQQPTPGPPEINQPKQEQSRENKTPSETRQNLKHKVAIPDTSSVKSLTPEKQEKSERDKPKTNEKTTTDGWLIGFTGILALATLIQAVILWRQIVHFRRTERPYVFVTVKLQDALYPPIIKVGDTERCYVMVHIKNHGKTPAILVSLRIAVNPRETTHPFKLTKLPDLPAKLAEEEIPEGIIVGAGDTYPYLTYVPLTTEEWNNIEKYDIWMICSGLVRYKDRVSNCIRKTGFLWQYYPFESQRRFGISSNKKLNYYT